MRMEDRECVCGFDYYVELAVGSASKDRGMKMFTVSSAPIVFPNGHGVILRDGF